MLAAVNVALRNGAAAVADPFSGEVFFTDGETAWRRHDGADVQLASTPAIRLVDVNPVRFFGCTSTGSAGGARCGRVARWLAMSAVAGDSERCSWPERQSCCMLAGL
jgi:hypothetical protein